MRDSVLFYRSFYDALKNVPPDERLRVYDSIMEYAMYDNEPDLDGVALAIFLLAKPQMLRRHLQKLVGVNEIQRLLQAHNHGRHQF